ncbi:MAG TPA: hypothetical protein VKM56_06925, partial [Verrucomicrobiae bacterium]|nr:hypothetical protein [Verrucomicrobiae bacterium]
MLKVSASASDFFVLVSAYNGTAIDALTTARTSPDGRVVVAAGDTIIFQVASIYYVIWGGGGGSGPFTMSLALEVPIAPSTNDFFANRLAIDAPFYHFEGSIYGATNELSEPLPAANKRQTLWWRFVAPEAGLLSLHPSSGAFIPTMALYEGSELTSLVRLVPLDGTSYRVVGSREYAVQMGTDYAPAGTFTLESRFYPSRYDMFVASQRFEGTNATVYGNNLLATIEANEPQIGETNTIWFSWSAPAMGRLTFDPGPRNNVFIAVYTGPTVDRLMPVRLIGDASVWSFLAEEGSVYHFQYAGMAHEVELSIQLQPLSSCSNDNFADAELVKGKDVYFDARSVLGATMELGEPLHRGPTPQKSLWWKWQAPANGSVSIWAGNSLVPDVVLAAYQGKAVESLRLWGKGTNTLEMPVVGGELYYIAGAVPADAVGDIDNLLQHSTPEYTPTVAVAGNLLQEPSWEGTYIEGTHYWQMSDGVGGYVNERGGADGSTWPA